MAYRKPGSGKAVATLPEGEGGEVHTVPQVGRLSPASLIREHAALLASSHYPITLSDGGQWNRYSQGFKKLPNVLPFTQQQGKK